MESVVFSAYATNPSTMGISTPNPCMVPREVHRPPHSEPSPGSICSETLPSFRRVLRSTPCTEPASPASRTEGQEPASWQRSLMRLEGPGGMKGAAPRVLHARLCEQAAQRYHL